MHVSRGYSRAGTSEETAPVKVGWLLMAEKGGVIYDPPRRLRSERCG